MARWIQDPLGRCCVAQTRLAEGALARESGAALEAAAAVSVVAVMATRVECEQPQRAEVAARLLLLLG